MNDKTKLKDLKYEIPGTENPKPGREALFSLLLVPAILLMIGICIIFGKAIDAVGWRTVVAVMASAFFLVMAFKYRKQ